MITSKYYGKTFGSLRYVSYVSKGKSTWLCECGSVKTMYTNNVTSGKTRSCGCMRAKLVSIALRGASRDKVTGERLPEYGIWKGIRKRCNNPNDGSYSKYGGRGITVCPRWDDFSKFMEDMGSRPSKMHSIERIDVNGDYEPSNCRWATYIEQANNKTNNVLVHAYGRSMTVAQWARELGVDYNRFQYRTKKYGGTEAIRHFRLEKS